MKPALLLAVVFLITSFNFFAQSNDSLKVNSITQEIKYKNQIISASISMADVIKRIGSPDRIAQIDHKDRYFIFDKIGMTFDVNQSGLIDALIINFNSFSGNNSPKKKFKGTLVIDSMVVVESSTVIEIKSRTKIKNMLCISKKQCLTDTKSPTIFLMVGYNQESLINKMMFGFKRS